MSVALFPCNRASGTVLKGDDSISFLTELKPAMPTSTGIEPEMIQIQGGEFKMGGDDGIFPSSLPLHNVSISRFSIAKFEVTLGEFRRFVADSANNQDCRVLVDPDNYCWVFENGESVARRGVDWRCNEAGKLRPESEDDLPVMNVSWYDAQKYCQWLSKVTGKNYRLPTEAQWEYAARGGGSAEKYSGGEKLGDVAWFKDNSGGQVHVPGGKKPNKLGIYDMSGNVFEWCADWYGEKYYAHSPKKDPQGPAKGDSKVLRGGAWSSTGYDCTVFYRLFNDPERRGVFNGFRVVLVE